MTDRPLASGKPSTDWWKEIGEWVHDHSIYTKGQPDTVEVKALYDFLDDLSARATPPEAVYREPHPHSAELYMAGVRDGRSAPPSLDVSVEQMMTAMRQADDAGAWDGPTPEARLRNYATAIVTALTRRTGKGRS